MKQSGMAVIMLLSAILFCSGCVSEPGVDKAKFSELDRIARDLQTAATSSRPCDLPDTLLQRLASETTAVKTSSEDETTLVMAFSNLLATYNDGLLICKHRTHLSQFQFVPKGRIYVFQELDPIVLKYDLPTEKHLYRPTGIYWRSIPDDSITTVWESAAFQLKNIENMMNYN
jgi:hypothetical protein